MDNKPLRSSNKMMFSSHFQLKISDLALKSIQKGEKAIIILYKEAGINFISSHQTEQMVPSKKDGHTFHHS